MPRPRSETPSVTSLSDQPGPAEAGANTNLKVSPTTRARVRLAAAVYGVSQQFIVETAINEFFESKKKEIEDRAQEIASPQGPTQPDSEESE